MDEKTSLESAIALIVYDIRKGKSNPLRRGIEASEKDLKRIIARYVACHDDREDVLGDVRVKIITTLPQSIQTRFALGFTDERLIGYGTALVRLITKHVCIDYLRRKATRNRNEAHSLDETKAASDEQVGTRGEDCADPKIETRLLSEDFFFKDVLAFLASENISPYSEEKQGKREKLRRLRRVQAFSMLLFSRRTTDKEYLTFENIRFQLCPQFEQTIVGCSLGTIYKDCDEMALLFFQWHNGV